jgi:hypothetical protein
LGILTKSHLGAEGGELMHSPSVKSRFKSLAKTLVSFTKKDEMGSQGSLHKVESPKVDKKVSPLGGSMMGSAQKAQLLQSKRTRSTSNGLAYMQQSSESSLSLSPGLQSAATASNSNSNSPLPSPLDIPNAHIKPSSSYRVSTLSKACSIRETTEDNSDSRSFIERELEQLNSEEMLLKEDRDASTDEKRKDLSSDSATMAAFDESYLMGRLWEPHVQFPPEILENTQQIPIEFVLIKLHLMEELPVIVKVSGGTVMEEFCQKICERIGLENESYSFEYGSELKPVEMDRKAEYLFNSKNPPDVHLVKKAKVYSSIATVENTEETIISNFVCGKFIIMAARKDRIFDLISSTDFEDEKFTNVFFLTFRSFCTPHEFLGYLILSFYCKLSDSASDSETETYQRTIVASQLKVLKVLHKWIEHHWHDFGLDSMLRTTLQIFLNKVTSQEGEFTEVCRGLIFVADIQVFEINSASLV